MSLFIRYIFLFFTLLLCSNAPATEQLDTKQTILVATHIDPPFVDYVDGEYTGEYVEITQQLAQRMNKTIQYITCPFIRCLALVKNGKADMIVAIRKSPEREEYLHYVEQVFVSRSFPVHFFTLKSNMLNITKYEDIKPLIIGNLHGARFNDRFDNDKQLNKIQITTHQQMINMLMSGRIDTFIGREYSIKKRASASDFEKIETQPFNLLPQAINFYIAVSKQSPLSQELKVLSENLTEVLADKQSH